jgi:hypothetical protein
MNQDTPLSFREILPLDYKKKTLHNIAVIVSKSYYLFMEHFDVCHRHHKPMQHTDMMAGAAIS